MWRGVARGLVGSLIFMAGCSGAAWAQAAAPEGTIAGKVLDAATGDPIIEAGVEVVGTLKKVRTDLDGKYAVKVPAGTYELRIFAPLYKGARLQGVVVRAGEVTRADASLKSEGQAGVEVVEVVAQAEKSTEAAQLIERKRSDVVEDNVGAQTIAKSPDRNVAEVVKRLPSVTVQNDKFVFVRGLGPRYTLALLNGSNLPSTDPNRRVIPLDLFPSDVVESISVMKTFAPNLPGSFSGGLVDIRLKQYPEQLTYTLGVSTSVNTNTTFQPFGTYEGSDLDYFGLGSQFRSIPSAVPKMLGTPTLAQGRLYSNQFRDIWNVQTQTAPPNFGVHFSIGSNFGNGGASLSGVYRTDYYQRWNEVAQLYANGGVDNGKVKLIPFGNLTFDNSMFKTRLAGVLTSGWNLTPTDKVIFQAFVDQSSLDQVINGVGQNRNNLGQPISQAVLYYEADRLGYAQLAGTDAWPWLEVNWRTAISQTNQQTPDQRFVSYNLPTPTNGLMQRQLIASGEGPESLERLFGDLNEYLTDSQVDFTVPFKTGLPYTDVWSGLPAKFIFGPVYSYRNRTFDYNRYRYTRLSTSTLTPAQRAESAEQQLVGENIGVDYAFSGGNKLGDDFTASQEVAGGYAMFDLPVLPDQLRLSAGVRTEYSYIRTNASGFPPVIVNNLNPLPGINLIYTLRNDMTARASYSQTVSRPEFRELEPTQFPAIEGQFQIQGNPLLTEATIDSYDLRWDWFLSPLEILSASFFYKNFTDPIESVVLVESASEVGSFANAKGGAHLYGFEVECRKNMGFLAPYLRRLSVSPGWLENLSLLANIAYIHSEVNIGKSVDIQLAPGVIVPAFQTNPTRALQGQAPYVVNTVLQYDWPERATFQLFYNTFGSTLAFAGTNDLPDIFEEPRGQLDAVVLGKISPFGVPVTAKLAVENILNSPVEFTQGGNTTLKYKTGATFRVSMTYTY